MEYEETATTFQSSGAKSILPDYRSLLKDMPLTQAIALNTAVDTASRSPHTLAVNSNANTATQQLVTCQSSADHLQANSGHMQYVFLDQSEFTEQTEIVEDTGDFTGGIQSSLMSHAIVSDVTGGVEMPGIVLDLRTVDRSEAGLASAYIKQEMELETSPYTMS